MPRSEPLGYDLATYNAGTLALIAGSYLRAVRERENAIDKSFLVSDFMPLKTFTKAFNVAFKAALGRSRR